MILVMLVVIVMVIVVIVIVIVMVMCRSVFSYDISACIVLSFTEFFQKTAEV